jgi:hypothetical protein
MDTAPLKSFATWSRTALIREVTARIAVVLAPASPQRVEQPKAVAALEEAIAAAGGGDQGQAAVAHRVAYTWFNRIIALRFMDANGYTGIGVVSPQAGVEVGQPEILAEAKRATIDPDVVSQEIRESVSALLNGTRRSDDPQGEAYALLLVEYCRHWNRAMPFMFEREGDFTELLMPANLLSDDSVLSRAGKALTEMVCRDVEVIGWLYQYYISERKEEVFAGFGMNLKAGREDIPAATQLFTPHWIVRFLVENSVGRLWMLNHPASRLAEKMDYYIAPVEAEADFLRLDGPEDLKVIDPACGSGHMLTYAFDLLYAIYEEEGNAPSEIPELILTNNLVGLEIDPRAGALAAFALTMKARARQRAFLDKRVTPRVCVLESVHFATRELDFLLTSNGDRLAEGDFWNRFEDAAMLGSLIQPGHELNNRLAAHIGSLASSGDLLSDEIVWRAEKVIEQATYLAPKYAVVIANPPYMGKRNMSDELRQFADLRYPRSAGDLCTMFMDRAIDMVVDGGLAALVVSESWLFTSTFGEMRVDIAHRAPLLVTACIDKIAFGVRLNTAASVLQRGRGGSHSQFFRVPKEVIDEGVSRLPPADETVYTVDVESFSRVPSGAFIFDLPASLLALYETHSTIGENVDLRVGLQTGDNGRFVRHWWEVSNDRIAPGKASAREAAESGGRWIPYNKGGTPIPWWSNQSHVVNWEHDGSEIRAFGTEEGGRPRSRAQNTDYYFRPALTWSNIGSGGARFRQVPQGFIFDVAGMSAFVDSPDELLNLLGYLNSGIVRRGLDVLAPTLNYQVGDVARLPFLDGGKDQERVANMVRLARAEGAGAETASEFQCLPLLRASSGSLQSIVSDYRHSCEIDHAELASLERASDEYWSRRIADESSLEISDADRYTEQRQLDPPNESEVMLELVSYFVGCVFGRYSLDLPGLVLADQGAPLQDYLAKVPKPTFMPDADNVIPIVDGDWFEDDIVTRFRQFLRTAFGEQHFEENLRLVTEVLGVKDLRDYFVKSFYKDHVQRYKKRPIYWLFSSPKGSFNALIYMHRYTPSTVSTVLNEYLREFKAKLEATLGQQERFAVGGGTPRQQAAAQKEADRIRKMLLELDEYEHDVLYPLAAQQIEIDLDDGVKLNYPKFGAALKKIPGLEASE